MSEEGDIAPADGPGASAALAFAIAGVLPAGDGAPRLRCRVVGGGYEDARVATGQVVAIGDGVELGFSLPVGPVDFILLEPAALPGSYRIPRMTWRGSDVDDLRRRVVAAEELIDDDAGPGGLRIVNGRGRPALEIDVRGLAGGAAGPRVGLVLKREADGAASAEGIGRLAGRLAVDLETIQAGIARLGREIASTAARVDGIGDVVSRLPGMAGTQARLEEGVDRLAAGEEARDARIGALEAQCAALATALEERSREHSQVLAGLIALVERTSTERAAAEAVAAEARAAVAAEAARVSRAAAAGRREAADEFAGVRHVLAEVQAQLERVTNSVENVFWRRWLRRLRGVRQ